MWKLVKTAIFAAFLYSGMARLRDLILGILGRSRVVVLYYHRVGHADVLSKTVEQFRADLEYLKNRYECLSLEEICSRIQAGARFPRPVVAITFDDGYRDNFLNAVPVLQSLGVPATFYVATGFISTNREFQHDLSRGDTTGSSKRPSPKLTWEDLREMERLGFEIGSHTVNHTNMGTADLETIRAEVNQSLDALNRELGQRPRAFSFPWGKPTDISKEALRAVREAGYYSAVSAYGGSNSRQQDVFDIRRVDAGNGAFSDLEFRARVAGLELDYLGNALRRAIRREEPAIA